MSETLQEISERHPLEHAYAEDGRYMWPERWRKAQVAFEALEVERATLQQRLEHFERFKEYLRTMGGIDVDFAWGETEIEAAAQDNARLAEDR